MCRVTVPCESDSGAVGGESRGSRDSGKRRERNGIQDRLGLLRHWGPRPSIGDDGSKSKNRYGEDACCDLQPSLTRARPANWFDWNCGLYRTFELTDEPIPPPRHRFDKARTLG